MTPSDSDEKPGSRFALVKGPLIVFVAALVVYGAVSADRLLEHSRDNHYVHLADGMLDGRLHLEGKPPHRNDWAYYDGKWFVSFPPAPAVLMIPGVALFGLEFNDRLFTLFFAAAGPALLLLLLQLLVRRGRLERRARDLWLLAGLYGIGTVYFFCAVQGTVWYTAHMVGGVLLLLFLISSLDGRHPLLAGLFLGLAFACRPPILLAFPFIVYEVLRLQGPTDDERRGPLRWVLAAIKNGGWWPIARRLLLFGLPILIIVGLLMAMNYARFDDPFEAGHSYLKVRWAARIERWGLFHYHFLGRNLAIVLASLPWLSATAPHLGISRHGLALWFTTPAFLWLLQPARRSRQLALLTFTALLIAVPTLLYQNSGWVQFGYRFSLDYTPLLLLMLAFGGRRFGKLFVLLALFAVAVNLFGAITFDRMWEFYPGASTRHLFQPD